MLQLWQFGWDVEARLWVWVCEARAKAGASIRHVMHGRGCAEGDDPQVDHNSLAVKNRDSWQVGQGEGAAARLTTAKQHQLMVAPGSLVIF